MVTETDTISTKQIKNGIISNYYNNTGKWRWKRNKKNKESSK